MILGVLLGFLCYLFDPFAGSSQDVPLYRVLIALALGLLLIPAPTLANRWTDTHPLNRLCWSLLQACIGNIAYVLLLRHMSARGLGFLAIISGAGLFAAGGALGTLDHGHSYGPLWMAPVRLCFPFVTGL